MTEEGGVYYEMWQKQLHDESETLSDTTQNIESDHSSTAEDNHKQSKPEKMNTQIIELADDTSSNENTTSSPPTTQNVETIELEPEEEEEVKEHVHNTGTEAPEELSRDIVHADEPENIQIPSTSTSSLQSLSTTNINKKKKKKRRSTRK